MSVELDPSLEEQFERARRGDHASLGEVLQHLAGYLTLHTTVQVGRLLQGKVDASDVVQETLLKAHRDFASFRGSTTAEFVVWLRRLLATELARLVRHHIGTQARDVRLERRIADDLDRSSAQIDRGLMAQGDTPSGEASARERAILLANALARLPDHYREVIVLHHLQAFTLAEVARSLGRTEDSVQKIWTRALVRLREVLQESP